MRKQHTLTPTTGKHTPKRFIFFDTETDQIPIDADTIHQKLKLGYAAYCVRQENGELELIQDIEFYDFLSLWSWITKICHKKSTTHLIAHNIVFDLTVMKAFQLLPGLGWELESFYSKGLVSIFRWSKEGARLIGLDSSNLFPGKLENLGENLNLPKLEIDLEDAGKSELMTYCKRDVNILIKGFESWFDFLVTNKCGSFKPTISSTAFNTWRHKHLDVTVHIHDNQKAVDLERQAYKGGRTECFFIGEQNDDNYYYLDINNMYGFVLQNYQYPARLWNATKDNSIDRLKYKLNRYAVIAKVVLDVSKPFTPTQYKDHTCYPSGSLEVVLTTPELKHAMSYGYIKEVSELSWYRKELLFENYIKDFRYLREEYKNNNQPVYEQIVKLLINGLYGKFGQKKMTQEKIGECDPNVFHREQVYDTGSKDFYDQIWLGGTIFREKTEGESFNSFPAIAAHVTAYARLYLNWFINQCPPGSVYYVDTDSLIVNQRGYDALRFYIDPNTIGMLKIELKSPWLVINAPKDYSMKDRIRRKGIKKDAQEISPGVYEQWKWTRLNGLSQSGDGDKYLIKRMIKRRLGLIHSGIVQPDGWVQPFHFQAGFPAPVSTNLRRILSEIEH